MKTLSYLLLAVFYTNAFSQDCSDYMHFKKGTSYEMENFDAKGNKLDRIESVVQEVSNSTGRNEALVRSTTFDKSNVKEGEGEYRVICQTDKVIFDISNMLKSDKMGGADKNMDIKIESAHLEIPKVLSIGQSLPENAIKITMIEKKSGNAFGTTIITIQDKKVEGKEKITTPAGSFMCYKITYNSKVEATLTMNNLSMPAQIYPGVYYVAPEVGLVKSVNYDKKKEVRSYTLLTKVKK